jgi:cell division protein FtsB
MLVSAQEIAQLESFHRVQAGKQELETSTLQQRMQQLRRGVATVHRQIQRLTDGSDDVQQTSSLRTTVEKVESQLATFKAEQRTKYDQLMTEERALNREVDVAV